MDSRRTTLCSAAALLLAQAAAADTPAIQSFDRGGVLTFREIENAVAYHVEGSVPQGWTNLVAHPPTGSGVVTGSVSVADPFMLYRVRAETREPSYLVVDLSGGPDAANYPVHSLLFEPPDGWTEEYRTTRLVLRRIAAGTFSMGSPGEELGRSANEIPHAVTLTRDFHIGIFEVTQAQWNQVMGDWPSHFSNPAYRGARPVESVAYEDVRGTAAGAGWPEHAAVDGGSFLGRLREKTGLAGLDLPSEAQWEYACRAGTDTALNTGADLIGTNQDPNMDAAGRYWFNGGSTFTKTGDPSGGTPRAGTYAPNAWGVYDMHGGVWEWCLDWYGAYADTEVDPGGAASGPGRVVRGGSWYLGARSCRSAFRYHYPPSYRNHGLIGFRIALNPE